MMLSLQSSFEPFEFQRCQGWCQGDGSFDTLVSVKGTVPLTPEPSP